MNYLKDSKWIAFTFEHCNLIAFTSTTTQFSSSNVTSYNSNNYEQQVRREPLNTTEPMD
jgi:hypothetical protein